MIPLILATIAVTVLAPTLGPQDFVERDNRSKYVGKLLANWKSQESGSVDESALQEQIVAFHELQAGKPGTAQFFETKKMWANELLPILLAGVPIEKAKFLAEFTRPFDEIVASDRAASNGSSTKPVGWEWQEANMLAEGDDEKELNDQFDVKAYPTLILLDHDGTVLRKAVGYQSVKKLLEFLK